MTKKATIYATGDRGVYVGRLERRFRRACASSTLLVSLEDELEVRSPVDGSRQVSRSFLMPAGTDVEVDTHGANVALFFLDDFGTDLSRLQRRMRSVTHLDRQHLFQDIGGAVAGISRPGRLSPPCARPMPGRPPTSLATT